MNSINMDNVQRWDCLGYLIQHKTSRYFCYNFQYVQEKKKVSDENGSLFQFQKLLFYILLSRKVINMKIQHLLDGVITIIRQPFIQERKQRSLHVAAFFQHKNTVKLLFLFIQYQLKEQTNKTTTGTTKNNNIFFQFGINTTEMVQLSLYAELECQHPKQKEWLQPQYFFFHFPLSSHISDHQ